MIQNPERRRFLSFLAGACISPVLSINAQSSGGLDDRQKFSFDQVQFGADYYPEDWPRERVETDARLMRDAGFRTVRLADTNWQRLEPAEGKYDFGWLEDVLDILKTQGLQAILCTSSYAPPAWLIERHPDFYIVNEAGVRHRWGGMGYLCLNNPLYRQYVAKLVNALVLRFGRNPNVIGWQIDNEMDPDRSSCYDEQFCQPHFRQYLKDKFGTIDELNRRLFTVSYGHSYSSWSQIVLPYNLDEQMVQVPLILESKRFFSKNIVDFVAFQAQLLRQNSHAQFITHNTYSVQMNCFDLAGKLDFLSQDDYPRVGQYRQPAFSADLMRGFNRGKSFQELEVRSGTAGAYTLIDATPRPGLVRLWAWQTLAHGADGLLFFRWRRNNGGSEQYWQGLLNFDGSPTSTIQEAKSIGAELTKIGSEFVGADSPAEVAAVFSYDSLWALQIGDGKFPYSQQLDWFSNAFRRWSLNVDIIDVSADLAKYRVVIAPSLHVVDSAIVEKLEGFVKDGGILVLTARSGFKNHDNLATRVPPGPLESLAKVSVVNYTLLGQSIGDRSIEIPGESGAYQPSPDNVIRPVSANWPGNVSSNRLGGYPGVPWRSALICL